MLNCEASVLAVSSYLRILLYLHHFFVFSFHRCRSGLVWFYSSPPTPTNLWISLTNIVHIWLVMQPFFCSEYLLKYLVPEIWNVDKSTLTWLSYFLSCFSFLTHILAQSINARWQLHFDTLNIYQVMWYAFEVFFLPFPSNELTHPSFIYSCF